LYSSLDIIKEIQYRTVTLAGHVGCTEEIRRATEFYLENLKLEEMILVTYLNTVE